MKKIRGLSAQEKQKAILDIFFETRDIFNKEEIEKEAKKKRVNNPQEIQEIVKNLVQDNLVNKDKVGNGAFFWSFPHEKKQEMVKVVSNIEEKEEQCKQKIEELQQKIEAETKLRSSADREKLIARFIELKSSFEKKSKQVNTLKRNDPKRVQELSKLTMELFYFIFYFFIKGNKIEEQRKQANLWGDNIETLVFYVKKKFFMSSQDVLRYRENLEIEQEMEYFESV